MTIKQFRSLLESHPEALVHWRLPDGSYIPVHYHITEVGRVRKDFVDCGGMARSLSYCALQVWVADDKDHRLAAGRLLGIMRAGEGLLGSDELPVEVEYECGAFSQYPLVGAESTSCGLVFHLGGKRTACLAPQKCGVSGGCC